MYKIDKTISDIRLIHPGKILKRYKIDDHTVKITGIVLEKPFKLQVTTVAKVAKAKKNFTYFLTQWQRDILLPEGEGYANNASCSELKEVLL